MVVSPQRLPTFTKNTKPFFGEVFCPPGIASDPLTPAFFSRLSEYIQGLEVFHIYCYVKKASYVHVARKRAQRRDIPTRKFCYTLDILAAQID
jgi:hypothetical protein